MAKAVKKRVVRAAVAARGRVARTGEAISEDTTRAKAGQAIATLRAMDAPPEALRAAKVIVVTIAGFAVQALAAMSK